MSFCVNIKSQQFKDTASRLGISEGNLELIAHKYGNQKETYGQFPSDNYIISQIVGRPEMNADPSTVRIWHEKYQQAQVFDSKEALNEAVEEARRFFEDSNIGISALPDGRVQMTVAEPNSTEEPLVSYMSNNAEQVIDGKLGVNKEQLISLLGSTMYKANVQAVAVKELLQNAFDAVKIAESQGKTKEKGKIKITLDDTKRTVTVSDNGIGMSPEIVQKAFFTIGGSYKGDNVDNRLKSGGLGLAKMAFLFSSNFVEVSTVKDGVKTYVKTNPEQIQGDNFKITTSKTDEPNGTTVTVGIPEYYMDENGERRDIWFLTRPSFLDEPMIGNVDVEVIEALSWTTRTKTYDKNQVPEGYTPIGKAASDFGDIEIYVAPQTSNTKYIYGKTLISGLHQFDYMFEAQGASKGRFKFIINILPTVGVKSAVYPINNQREGFRATVEPEVSDIAYLMTQINRALERKSITEAFGSAMSMDVGEVAEVQRESSKENILNETVEEIKKKYAQQQKKILGVPVGKTPDNSISLNDIRVERKKAEDEKKRKSSLDTSGVRFKDSEVSSIDTSKLDVTKPLFHNNTNMVIEEDGQRVLNEIGKLLMELKSLYTQTYKESGILSYNGEPVVDYISKQFWGISFDKGYGGVNVNPSVINMLAINPFYQVREYKGVDTALALTEYLTHLVIHEFNHNYARSEDARFTGRFPATYAEFAGIGKQFNREWKNKLYVLIRDNLETFVKYNKRYEQATNLGESFEGNKVTTGEESTSSRIENDGKDLFWNRSGENVYKDGEGVNEGESVSQSAFIQNAEFYSGKADGSDTVWAQEARDLGIRVTDYTTDDYDALSRQEKERIEKEYVEARGFLGKPVLSARTEGGKLTRRDMMQADSADAIFAIAESITPPGGTEYSNGRAYINRSGHDNVAGGTANAVARGIIRGIPVYVFDQSAKVWKTWNPSSRSFVEISEPVLTPHAATIGTRGINEDGRLAISRILSNSLSKQAQPQQQSQQTIDIWAGQNPTNADLSNMAQRPFRYNGVTYNSVEQAFQSAKLGYAAPITQQYPDVQVALNNPNLSPFDAKAFGRKIIGLDQARWDADSPAIMKTLIKESFRQNPQALQRLLATGDAILTHTRERADSRWRTEFPRILMEVRSELRGEQGVSLGQQVAIQGTTQQYGVVIDSRLKSNYTQWQQQNPNGLVAYRVHFEVVSPTDHHYNRASEAESGWIGNPFSEGEGQTNKGVDTVQRFFDWLTTGNNFGEPLANEEYRQAIIQKLLNTPVGTPILYYKELGRPSHATILGYLINHKELIGSQQTVVSQTPTPQPVPATPKVEEAFHKKSTGLVGQINNLLNSGLMATEVREEANKLMDWISDQLTQYLEDPSIVWDKCFASTQDASEREAVIEKISKMSREELLGLVKVDKMLEFYEKEVLERTEENAEYYDNDDSLYDLAETLKPNLKGLIQLGYSRFLEREGFSITLSEGEETTFDVSEVPALSEDVNPDDTNGENNQDYDSEEDGNKQDHWQIESRTRGILADASGAVRQALSNCYVLVDNGKVKEDGTPDYDTKKDRLGRKERISQVNATRSIVRWAQGSLKISDMIDRLSAKEKENPWISQILTRLRDTSGKEADFQSQFFTVFLKHFQPYSVVVRNADGTYHTSQVNAHPALDDAMTAISVQFRLGKLPLFNSEGVDKRNLELLSAENDKLYKLGKLTEENRDAAIEIVGNILEAIGFPQPADAIGRVLNNDVRNNILTAVSNMTVRLRNEIGNKNFDPFKYKDNPNGVAGYVRGLLRPFTEALEDVMVSAVFDSGKMYQSYITPSWTTKLFQKMHLDDAHFKEFLLDEFATSEWFIGDANLLADVPAARLARMSEAEKREAKAQYLKDHPEVWRTPWLKEIVSMDEKTRQEAFVHRVQLNFNKSNYMRGMNDLEYVLSVFTEFYADSNKNYRDKKFAYYRLPMLSNKPSNEFIRFTRYSGTTALDEISNEFLNIFNQEMSRIQTVMMRNLKEGDEGFIKNFDERGREFQFLDYLNKYLGEEKESVVGKLIADKLAGKTIKESSLTDEILKEIKAHLKTEADALVQQYRENGLFEALKNIENIGESDAAVERAIREFSWNDALAQANILELLVTDKAYYGGEEDLQKRLAQVHSPGVRGNWDATDYEGNRVSDGKLRVVKIADFKGKDVILNTIANLEEVFDRKIAEADPSLKAQWRAMKESIIDAYKDVNVVDGQAFVSPTAYRKKAIAFGEWSRDAEATYNAIRENRYNLPLLKSVFNPRKPFTYGKTDKKVSLNPNLNTPIKTLNYGVQYKDSEYLLIMADAILRGENTSRPNLLGALFDVMEESAAMNPTAGVDFIVFDSGVKSGLSGAISISDLVENPDGREIAFSRIWNSIFEPVGNFSSIREAQQSKTNPYNEQYVDILNAEDYSNQQTVPEHFMHGSLQWGSQIRAIMPSDLEVSFMGQPVQYQFYDDAAKKWVALDKKGMREEWDKTTAAMINESLETVKKELGLDDSSYSQADRNVILSKILQREILHNGRYGVDLLLACSVDENGNFRIPLGDPIQSKRVEQLINSVIKNRVNKQKVEGGTLVEVTNFGTSKRLERRYLDKRDPEGKTLLKSKADYLAEGHSEAEFDQYVKDNQAGIAYDECYAPAWAREVFEKFADINGNIDVEAIEMIDPDFLKMYGYRIPTEEKYSGAPYKIIGFLPKEAGDGFMQPWETTVTDGSDFDVDKKNLMRMAITLKSKIMSKREYAEAEGITDDATLDEKYKAYRKEVSPSAEKILQKIGESGVHTLSSSEEADIKATSDRIRKNRTERAKKARENKDESALDAYNRKYAERVEPLEKQYEELSNKEDLTAKEERDMLKLDRKIEREIAKLDRELEGAKAKNETAYNEELEQIDRRVEEIEKENRTNMLRDKKLSDIRTILEGGIFRNSSTLSPASRKLFLAIKQAYLDMMYESVKPTEGRGYLNNKIFNMQWAIATHASTADKMLNPGNFDPQKRMGYMAAAYRAGNHTWEELQGMTIKELKNLAFTNKNLMDFSVQTQFYKQNNVAGQILGIFAVARSAHAILEGRNYAVNVEDNFTIAGMDFGGLMPIDKMRDRTGVTLIGKTLGSLVGASADAVKDPVLNFMNINKETVNVLNAALRLGMDFDSAALLLSSKAITDILNTYYRNSLFKSMSLGKVVSQRLRKLEDDSRIGKDSALARQELTTEEMIRGIKDVDVMLEYKTLKAFQRLSNIASAINPLTNLSRLNSVKSAVGPTHIDSIMSKRKFNSEMKNLVKIGENGVYENLSMDTVFKDIPSLQSFYEAYNIVFGIEDTEGTGNSVDGLFKQLGITTATQAFENVLDAIPSDMAFTLYNNKKLLSSLGDFFQSYLLVQSGAVDIKQMERYTKNFAKWYAEQGFKSKYPNNPFIQAIQTEVITKKGEQDKYVLKIETTGMEQSEKDALSSGWIQLEKDNPQLSHWLFYYNFWRGGVGFSPKTFMGLVPLQVKENIAGYISTYRSIPSVVGSAVFDQWIRNNWGNDTLVPRVYKMPVRESDGRMIARGNNYYNVAGHPYVKMRMGDRDVLFRRIGNVDSQSEYAEYEQISSLGNNREYFEAYPSSVTPPVQHGTALLAEKATMDSDQMTSEVDNPNDVVETPEETQRALTEFADQLMGDPNRTAELETAKLEDSLSEAIKDLGLKEDSAKFDDMMDEFC